MTRELGDRVRGLALVCPIGVAVEHADGDWSTEAALLLAAERACDAILVE